MSEITIDQAVKVLKEHLLMVEARDMTSLEFNSLSFVLDEYEEQAKRIEELEEALSRVWSVYKENGSYTSMVDTSLYECRFCRENVYVEDGSPLDIKHKEDCIVMTLSKKGTIE